MFLEVIIVLSKDLQFIQVNVRAVVFSYCAHAHMHAHVHVPRHTHDSPRTEHKDISAIHYRTGQLCSSPLWPAWFVMEKMGEKMEKKWEWKTGRNISFNYLFVSRHHCFCQIKAKIAMKICATYQIKPLVSLTKIVFPNMNNST